MNRSDTPPRPAARRTPGRPLAFYVNALQQEYARCRLIPSYDTLLGVFHLKSKQAVTKVLQRLQAAGYVEPCVHPPGYTRWVPGRRFFERVLTSESIRAGFPSPATEALSDTITLDEYLIEKPASTVMVAVKDDAMAKDGILAGDLVIVEKIRRARNNDLVVALVDGEAYLRRLRRLRGEVWLEAADPQVPPIHPREQLQIQGVVVGLVRKMTR